jgi:hypothetical protein
VTQSPPESGYEYLSDITASALNAACASLEAYAQLSTIFVPLQMAALTQNPIFSFYAPSPAMQRKQNAMLRRKAFHIVSG